MESTRWKEQDRFVAHLSKAADGDAEGTDVNSRSTIMDTIVQADYIDQVVVDLVDFLRCDGRFSESQLILMEADIKAAFKCVDPQGVEGEKK